MFQKLISLLLCVLLLLSTTSVMAEDTVITLTDMYGRQIVLAEPATRIVALTAADCEILCALGCEEALVGRGAYCDYPESILGVTVVASGAETNVEEILALEPQVVLMGDMSQSKEQVDILEQNGVKVAVSNANDIAGTYTAIRMIGKITGKEAEAEALIADMQSTFDEIAAKSSASGKTVYFEVTPLQWGLWTAGNNTFMNELASICGLTNAFQDVDGWAAINEEQVLARDPDYIVSIAGLGEAAVEEIVNRPGWGELNAVVNGQVFDLDANAIARPGPRLKDAAIELFNYLNAVPEEEPGA